MRNTSGSVSRYTPEPVTDEGTNRELQRIASAMSAIADGQLDVTTVAPAKPRAGMIRYTDGVSWNPGAGAGFYGFHSGSWAKLG